MTDDADRIYTRARRLLLAVATGHDDARQGFMQEIGFDDVDRWVEISYILAEEAVAILDGEFATVQMLAGKDMHDIRARAREATIKRIEYMLKEVLDQS